MIHNRSHPEICQPKVGETGKPPQERHLLLAVLRTVRGRGAKAVLVPSRATISPIDGEFDEFAGEIEKAGGFIQVTRR
ncbi:hypothetical protein ABTZ03_29930 [Kitasatospora sp. NPDC096077]|uniref:hypothetical protein n=1 Tax=Kitasatospora sp. NPDC096077 TaxID=3155544 RepID=UPI003324C629